MTTGRTEVLASPAAPSLAAHFAEVVGRANAGLEDLPNTVRADNIYLSLRMHRWAGRLASATDRIWPCATPFMFRRPLEIALTAPIAARAHDRMMRRLIEHLSPALARLPMAGGWPAAQLRPSNLLQFLRRSSRRTCRRASAGCAARSASPPPRAPIRPPAPPPPTSGRRTTSRALLRPDAMKTAHLYEPAALAAFFADSQSDGATTDSKLGRDPHARARGPRPRSREPPLTGCVVQRWCAGHQACPAFVRRIGATLVRRPSACPASSAALVQRWCAGLRPAQPSSAALVQRWCAGLRPAQPSSAALVQRRSARLCRASAAPIAVSGFWSWGPRIVEGELFPIWAPCLALGAAGMIARKARANFR